MRASDVAGLGVPALPWGSADRFIGAAVILAATARVPGRIGPEATRSPAR